MKNLAVARRYAKALLLIGKEDGQTDAYRKELSGFAGLMAQEEALNQAITNPLYEASGRRNVLQAVTDNLAISKTMKSFLLLLFDKGRIGFVDSINEFYQKLADELNGIARARLVSATGLSDDTVEKIRAALCKKTEKEIILEVEQDPALIGGIVTQIGDLVWRGVKPALARELVHHPPLARIDPADGRRRIAGQLLGVGQVAAIHPENTAHDERRHDGAIGERAEDRAEERSCG